MTNSQWQINTEPLVTKEMIEKAFDNLFVEVGTMMGMRVIASPIFGENTVVLLGDRSYAVLDLGGKGL